MLSDINDLDLFIWSSNSKAIIEKVLQEYQLETVFDKVITRSDVGLIKPYPEGFSHIHEHHRKKEDYLFVGDSAADQLAAQAVGIDFFKISYF